MNVFKQIDTSQIMSFYLSLSKNYLNFLNNIKKLILKTTNNNKWCLERNSIGQLQKLMA